MFALGAPKNVLSNIATLPPMEYDFCPSVIFCSLPKTYSGGLDLGLDIRWRVNQWVMNRKHSTEVTNYRGLEVLCYMILVIF